MRVHYVTRTNFYHFIRSTILKRAKEDNVMNNKYFFIELDMVNRSLLKMLDK